MEGQTKVHKDLQSKSRGAGLPVQSFLHVCVCACMSMIVLTHLFHMRTYTGTRDR